MSTDGMAVRFEVAGSDGAARAGRVETARGGFDTPCFMPVGTRAAVRTLDPDDLEGLGVEALLANTYHLMLKPGAEVVAAHGGIHGFMGWGGHVITDSGGYQVFSLAPRVDDDGVTFRSTYDGSTHRLTPELAVGIQRLIGADVQMVLDVCPPWPCAPSELRLAVDRTASWAKRASREMGRLREGELGALGGASQALFGIVQGGVDPVLRSESARRTVEVGFDGYAVGGLSVGEPRQAMLEALGATIPELPADQPRYLMGVGDPVGLIEAIASGVDMFDCVLPTRLGRHGTLLTSSGRLNLRNKRFAADTSPPDEACGCRTCARWSRAHLRHLVMTGEPTGGRLATMHNLAWLLDLVGRARRAVLDGDLDTLRAQVADVWAKGADQAPDERG